MEKNYLVVLEKYFISIISKSDLIRNDKNYALFPRQPLIFQMARKAFLILNFIEHWRDIYERKDLSKASAALWKSTGYLTAQKKMLGHMLFINIFYYRF